MPTNVTPFQAEMWRAKMRASNPEYDQPRTHTPATHDQPPELTAKAGRNLEELRDAFACETYRDPERPEVEELHEEFGHWCLRRLPPVDVDAVFGTATNPVRHVSGTLYERLDRWPGSENGQWRLLEPDRVWAELSDKQYLVDEFLQERLDEALNPTGPDCYEEV